MAYSIALNSTNVVGMGNNTYKYNFLNGFTVPEDSTISISQITIPYSWFNITKALGNNTFQYIMPTSGATTVTRTITLTDGFYDITALNQALWADLKSQNYYFYNSTISTITPSTSSTTFPTILYPISFSTNYNGYNNAITFQYIPTSIGNVTTQYGANWFWALGTFPTNANTPQIVITGSPSSTTTLFGNIIGFQAQTTAVQTYALVAPTISNSAPYVVLGNSLLASPPFPALATPVNTVCVRCNLVDNSVAMPTDLMDFFPISSQFGSNIYYLPIADNAVKIRSGKHQSLTVTLCDQNFNPLIALDPNVLISILINFPEKKHIPAGWDRGKQIQKGLI